MYTASQVASDTSADATGQTRQILEGLDRLLTQAGTDKSRLLSTNIWVADMADFNAMNDVWDAWVAPGHSPARACVQARLATPALKIEIMVVVALPD